MKKDNLFVGVGQAGSNIAYEMQLRGYTAFYINTTIKDIQNLDIEERFVYHIPAATGCARNRRKALEYTKEYFTTIDELLNTNFSTFKNIFVAFSGGGGTGSGISPALISVLSKKYPNKNFAAIMILPSKSESLHAKKNTIECFKQIKQIKENIKNIYYLDNSSATSKKEVNETFANDFDTFINIPNFSNIDGNIDDDEIQKLIEMQGNAIFGTIESNTINYSKIYPYPAKESKGAYIVNNNENKINYKELFDEYGMPLEYFECVSDVEKPLVGVFGMNILIKRISEIAKEIQEEIENKQDEIIEQDDFLDTFEMPDILKDKKQDKSKKRMIDNVDLDKEFEIFFN